MNEELFFASAASLASRIRAKQLSAVEVTEAFLRRIDAKNAETNSFVTVTHDLALQAARRADEATMRGESLGPLHGIPVAIKDLFDLRKGVRNTWGSVPLKDFVAPDTCGYVERLESAGAVIVGKTNAPEFGHRGITDNYVTGATSTPFAPGRNSGGSSGGAAAAVAAGLVPLSQGTDGGGSIRIPAAWCGVFGYKASFGRVGDVARPDGFISSSPFGLVGPMARSVDDAALMLKVIGRPDPRDPFSVPTDPSVWEPQPISLAGLRIAYLPTLGGFPIAADVAAVVERAATLLEQAGAQLDQPNFVLPADQYELGELWVRLIAVLYVDSIDWLEAHDVHLFDHLDELTPAFAEMLVYARRCSVMEQRRDHQLRTKVLDAVVDVFATHDLIITPTLALSPVENQPDGATVGPSEINGVPVNPSIGWCLTYPFNFTGHPAASVPCGFTAEGYPVGLQVVAPRWADRQLLDFCRTLEELMPWAGAYPGLKE